MISSLQTASMACPLRIEFPGALYQITSRSNARPQGENHEMFLTTSAGLWRLQLALSCLLLKGNHIHMKQRVRWVLQSKISRRNCRLCFP